ncbi:hypothetical protein [Streptomyces sp. NPDC101776]|uniref:hypothetical protein n=1 Tax=Streptomyces sp. NPDC101776 TaxID=3366146 RepID=UPI003805DA07
MARDENMIAALKRERAVYVSRGDEDRVSQVDESLAHYGYGTEPDEADGPQGRTAAPQQTADQGKAPTARKPSTRKATAPATPPPSDPSTGDQTESPAG